MPSCIRCCPFFSRQRPAASRRTTAPSWSCPRWPPGLEAVVSLTARAYVCTALPEDEALHLVPDAYGGATHPSTLLALVRGGTIGVLDATLVREGVGEPVLPVRHDLDDHPRVRHARAVRCDVVVRGDERGLVTLATGAAGRRELSVQALRPGTGDGRSLIRDALVGETGPVFAAVSPGNARSLRTTTPCCCAAESAGRV